MGKRYIDSEAFFKVINTLPYKDTSYPDASAYNGAISDVADMLTHFPAADVEEVRHGHWKGINRNKYNDDEATCSVCGVTFSSGYSDPSWWDYCPKCGSRMDLEGDIE